MTQEEIKILQGLNPAQEAAVRDFQSPSLIVAGAGSGKTRVLTCRIAWMIAQGVAPFSIMALTFTNKAAREMRERITALVGEERSRYIWMGTFHSVFLKILAQEVKHIGFEPNFTIYDTGQSESLIKSILKEMQLSDEVYKVRDVRSRISLAKNNLVTAEAYESNAHLIEDDKKRRQPQFWQVYKNYCARCKQNNAMDFDDLLLQTNILFRYHPEVLEKYQHRFPYILVDEYQDTNYAQYLIVRKLAGETGNVCVVGDDAQSIYSFRGAKIENIFRFQKDFPSARLYKLEQNYRSTQTIVDAANSIIEHNQHRIKKRVFSENNIGEKIKVVKAYTEGEEAQMVANGIRGTKIKEGCEWSDIAVLYRTNAQSRALEEALRKRDIPYRIYGGHSFYDRKEVKDVMAYFKTLVNPKDDESLLRIINYPARGIGDVTIGKIRAVAQSKGVSLWEAIRDASDEEKALFGKKVLDFYALIHNLSLLRGSGEKTLYEVGLEVVTRSGILSAYKLNPSPENENALQNIEELLNSMQNFRHEMIEVEGKEEVEEPTLEVWLQNISLLTDMDSKEDGERNWVTLLTAHSSKGLEFDHVYITGMEENLFPSVISLTSPDQIEEERRLFYVAVTRAKRHLTITYASTRFKWGSMEFSRPSRFLKEIDPRFVDGRFDDDEEEMEERQRGRSQIEELKRRFDQRQGRTIVERREFQSSRITPATPQPPKPNVSNMRSMGVRSGESEQVASVGEYAVGQRVSHARFGGGRIEALEKLTTDTKITVLFDNPIVGRKALLAKYAKLRVES